MQVCCKPSSFTLHNYPYLQMRNRHSERLSQFLMEILEERQPVWGESHTTWQGHEGVL